MNILILNWRDPSHPLAGGAELSLLEHAKHWKKKGADVTWFSSSFNNAAREDKIDGIKIIRYGSHFTVHLYAFVYYLKKGFRDIDIVIDCFHFVPYFSPLYFKNKKIIAWINEPAKNAWFKNIIFPFSLIGYLLEPLFFLPYRKIKFITSATSIKKELVKMGLKNIEIIEHGIKIISTQNTKKEKDPTIIYLAQITPDKGIQDGLDAFEIVAQQIKNAKFWIIGKAPDKTYLNKIKQYVLDKKLNSSVKFFGFVEERKKFELLSKGWILIHPSIREGWGLNIIEANGAGTPAVGYDVVGLRDSIQNNKTGLLSAPNPQSMAEKCLRIIKNKRQYNEFSRNARIYSSAFSWNDSGSKSYNLLMRLTQ